MHQIENTEVHEPELVAAPEQEAGRPPRARNGISKRLVVKSVFSNWAFLLVNAVTAFWMTPFVVRHLGDSAYGIWALVLQLTGYMGVVDVGLRSALVRFISRFYARGDQAGLNRLLSATLMTYGIFAPICIAIGVFMSAFVLPHMQIAPNTLRMAQITLVIAAGIVACDFLFATPHAILAGLSRWDLINGSWITMVLIRTGLIILFLKMGFGLVTLALVQLVTYVAGYSAEVVIIRLLRLLPGYQFIWRRPDYDEMKPVVRHSWYSFLLSLANRVNYQVDTIVIAVFLPVGEVTFYIIGLRLIEYLRDLLNSSTMIVAPLVSSLEAVGDSPQVSSLLVRSTKYSLMIGLLGGAGLLSLGKDFIRLWMGARFENPAGNVLVILTLGMIVSCTQFASAHILFGLSKHQINLAWTAVESVLNLSLSIVLVRHYGIFGVAAGTAIANLVVRGWLYPLAVLKALEVPRGVYLVRGILPAIAPTLAFLASVTAYKSFFVIRNYGELVLALMFGLVSFLALLWLFGLDEDERALALKKGRQAFSRA
jgi:O-antigen/teichoic acid export membrane protein